MLSGRQRKKRYAKIFAQVKEFTMVPPEVFADNLELIERYGNEPGCVVECGVWKGGMSAAMALMLGKNRNYFLFDSFEGLPDAKEIDGSKAKAWQDDKSSPFYFDNCRAEENDARKAMQIAGAEKAHFIKGFFSETLPGFTPPEPIRVLRLDGDWYESTMDCLKHLYKHLAPGAIVILDDYYLWEGCTKAVHDFFSAEKLPHPIRQLNNGNVHYFIKK